MRSAPAVRPPSARIGSNAFARCWVEAMRPGRAINNDADFFDGHFLDPLSRLSIMRGRRRWLKARPHR